MIVKQLIASHPYIYRVRHMKVKVNSTFLNRTMYFFFDDIISDFKTNSATYNTRSFYSSMKIVEKSKQIGIITFKGSTNLGLDLPTVDARSDDPRLVRTC